MALPLDFGWLLLAEDLSPVARGELLARGGVLLEAGRVAASMEASAHRESTASDLVCALRFASRIVPVRPAGAAEGATCPATKDETRRRSAKNSLETPRAEGDDNPVGFRIKKKESPWL